LKILISAFQKSATRSVMKISLSLGGYLKGMSAFPPMSTVRGFSQDPKEAIIIQTSISSLDQPEFRRLPRTRSGVRRNDEKENPFLLFVSPAKAGVQFKVFKRKGPPNNDVYTVMDTLFSIPKESIPKKLPMKCYYCKFSISIPCCPNEGGI